MVQFGFTPSRIAFRLSGETAPIVLANSIPKSGTHLLTRALYLMHPLRRKLRRTLSGEKSARLNAICRSLRAGDILVGHLKYSQHFSETIRANNLQHILITRDPRDIAVSNFIWITYKDKGHELHDHFRDTLRTDSERLMASLTGVPGEMLPGGVASPGLRTHISDFLGWQNDPQCLVIKFEDLIGSKGGGDDRKQLNVVTRIQEHIGLSLDEAELRKVATRLFNPASRTFFKGQIGTWHEYFTADQKRICHQELGDVIKALGYDSD